MKQNPIRPLVVDLDGTLIKTDLLFESFFSALSHNFRVLFTALLALINGKAALKSYLYLKSDIDVELLPYNEDVLSYVRSHRAKGGRTILATASHRDFAVEVANYTKLFDEVFGTSEIHNLKGSNKAKFLVDKFGDNNFDYIGDSHADIAIWRSSHEVITVNAGPLLRRRTSNLDKPVKHLVTIANSFFSNLKALRPHQWAKNVLIFIPVITSYQLSLTTLTIGLYAFISFSLVASSVYVLNDLLDLGADRCHATKKFRPLASGLISIKSGMCMAPTLLMAGLLIAYLISWPFLLVLLLYFFLTTLYSLVLKSLMVIDICILAGLYTLRIYGGGVAYGIDISFWLLAFSVFFFLSLASVKRQAELVAIIGLGTSKIQRRGYSAHDLPIISMISLAAGYVSVLIMALFLNSNVTQASYTTPEILWGICVVLLYWITRAVLLTNRGNMNVDPVLFALKDRVSAVCFLLIISCGLLAALL